MAINRDKILQEAQKLTEKKRFDKAIAELQKLVAEDPNDVRTLLKIGDLYLKMAAYAEAVSTYEHVGQFYSAQGFAVKAVAVYKQIREIIQKHAPHLEDRFGHIVPRLAELLLQLDLKSDALAYYDEIATRLQRLGRDRDAIDVFRKIVGIDPSNPISHIRLADAYVRVRDLDSAVEAYGTSSEILLRVQRIDDALRVLERLLQHRQDARYARTAASAYLDRGQPNDAMAALTKLQIAFKENPKDLPTLGLLARSFDQLGQPTKAVEVQKEAARIARDAGDGAAFESLLAELKRRAPDDEGVRQLEALGRVAPSVPAPARSEPPPAVEAPRGPFAPVSAQAAPAGEQHAIDELDELDEVELADDELDLVEEDEEPVPLRASYPPEQEYARQALGYAEAYRAAGQYDEAIATLRDLAQREPQLHEPRERLCDVLIEAGRQDEAIAEMLDFARSMADLGDADGAARLLDEVLLLEPNCPPALSLLQALGYAVPELGAAGYEVEAPEAGAGTEPPAFDPAAQYAQPSYGSPEYAQQGYGSPEYAQQGYAPPAYGEPGYAADSYAQPGYAPDPYAQPGYAADAYAQSGYAVPAAEVAPAAPHEGYRYDPRAPLPSYDLEGLGADDVMSQQRPELVGHYGASGTLPPTELDEPFAPDGMSVSGALPAYPIDDEPYAASREGAEQLDESALEEVEFFIAQGMLDEAANMLGEQLAKLPHHPLLLDKQRELEAARAESREASLSSETDPGSAYEPADRSFDIAHALDALDDLSGATSTTAAPVSSPQVSVEAIFEQFKAGIASQIAESDAATHYDLGMAYKEMGLVADAITEFELASRDPSRECVCQSMIGMMHMERGNIEPGIDAFLKGLHASHKTPEQELALLYEIGNAYDARTDAGQAIYYFQLAARIDPSYRDPRGSVAERIATLERASDQKPPTASRAAAGGAPDEFDEAFDDLFNPKD